MFKRACGFLLTIGFFATLEVKVSHAQDSTQNLLDNQQAVEGIEISSLYALPEKDQNLSIDVKDSADSEHVELEPVFPVLRKRDDISSQYYKYSTQSQKRKERVQHRSVELAAPIEIKQTTVVTEFSNAVMSQDLQDQMDRSYFRRMQLYQYRNDYYLTSRDGLFSHPSTLSLGQQAQIGQDMARAVVYYAKDQGIIRYLKTKDSTRGVVVAVEAAANSAQVQYETANNWKLSSGYNPFLNKTWLSAQHPRWDVTGYSIMNFAPTSKTPSYSLLGGGFAKYTNDVGVRTAYKWKRYTADSAVNFTESVYIAGISRSFTSTLTGRLETSYTLVESPRPPQAAAVSVEYLF